MSWRRLHSRSGVPTAPRKYFVVTMLAELTLQKSGNSTPRCSKLTDPSRQFVITTSRRSQVTSSYGWTPSVVHTRSTRRPLPVVVRPSPLARTVSSTRWASSAMASSSTGRPWQALRTPVMILLRLNGSVTPLRLTTARTGSSTVVNRLPHPGHARRRRISWPSSASRESTTRESAWRQYGHRIAPPPLGLRARRQRPGDHLGAVAVYELWRSRPQPVDDLHPCNY